MLGSLGAGAARAENARCGLDSRNRPAVPLPVVGDGVMSPAMLAALNRAYQMGAVEYRSAEAETELKRLLAQAVAEHNACAEALAEFQLGSVDRLIHLTEAHQHYARAEELFQTIGTPLALALVHLRLAALKHMTGDNPGFLRDESAVRKELLDAGDEATEIEEETGGIEWADKGDTTEQQAALYARLEKVTLPNVASVRGSVERNWGADLRRRGKLAEAMVHLRAVIANLTQCGCNPSALAVAYLEMALASDEGSDDAAVLRYALAGDGVYQRYHLDSFRPQALRVIAAAYGHRHEYAKQIATLQTALSLAQAQHATFAMHQTSVMLAETYGNAQQPLKGLEVLAQTQDVKATPNQLCLRDGMSAILEMQAGLYEKAAVTAAPVLTRCSDGMGQIDFATLAWNAAQAELHLGRTELALAHAKQAVTLVDADRSHLEMTDRNLVEFNSQQTNAYTVLIESLLAAKRPEEALLASEQGRARAFVDLALTSHQDAAAKTDGSALKTEVHPFLLSAADMRRELDRSHATLISYWMGDGKLFTWVMAAGRDVVVREQPMKETQMAELVRATLPLASAGMRRGVASSSASVRTRGGTSQVVAAGARGPWSALYDVLIAPIADVLPQEQGALLTIVPQGALFQLAFPALRDSGGHYLIERFALNTVPAAGVLDITAKNDAAASQLAPQYLVLANPERFPSVNGVPLSPLPGTAAEAHSIARTLKGQPVTMLEGRQAGLTELIGNLPSATVLHFATHAVVSDTAPATSFLALDRGQGDGKLTAASVYGLHLHANMVVLSACSTGRGQISGDGVAGLSRAFFYAGAASLVTTLWDVVDEPTAQLMPKFYAGLGRGESRSAALREAQLGLIRDLRAHKVLVATLSGAKVSLPESPAYWAAFSLSGQP